MIGPEIRLGDGLTPPPHKKRKSRPSSSRPSRRGAGPKPRHEARPDKKNPPTIASANCQRPYCTGAGNRPVERGRHSCAPCITQIEATSAHLKRNPPTPRRTQPQPQPKDITWQHQDL